MWKQEDEFPFDSIISHMGAVRECCSWLEQNLAEGYLYVIISSQMFALSDFISI